MSRGSAPARLPNPQLRHLTAMSQTTSSQALYNFRLLSALRSDDAAQVQAFIDEAANDPARSGVLLGTAVKVGTSTCGYRTNHYGRCLLCQS